MAGSGRGEGVSDKVTTEFFETSTGNRAIINWTEKVFSIDIFAEIISQAKVEIAKKVWEEHSTEIMAKMDLKGLANLIAVQAAKRIAEDIKL